MMVRIGTAVLLAAIVPWSALTAPSPARAGDVDITPPEVGSCHDLTYDEYLGYSEPAPSVECSERHTSMTIQVKAFDSPPDWHNYGTLVRKMYVPCKKALIRAAGGNVALFQMTSYGLTFYRPTKAQRHAGAAWIRCDAILHGGRKKLAPVPSEIGLGTPPHPAQSVRKCYLGKRADFATTVCSRSHQFVSLWTVAMRGDHYPGVRAAKRFAARKCYDIVGDPAGGDPFVYEWVGSRADWRAGYRYAVCSPLDE